MAPMDISICLPSSAGPTLSSAFLHSRVAFFAVDRCSRIFGGAAACYFPSILAGVHLEWLLLAPSDFEWKNFQQWGYLCRSWLFKICKFTNQSYKLLIVISLSFTYHSLGSSHAIRNMFII